MNEIEKTMQDMKEVNKNIEILKKNKFEMNSSIFQTKISIKMWLTEESKLKIEHQKQKTKYRN
jgi:hypothetical protein